MSWIARKVRGQCLKGDEATVRLLLITLAWLNDSAIRGVCGVTLLRLPNGALLLRPNVLMRDC